MYQYELCFSPSEYLQQESKDKKGKVMDTTGWSLHSKKRNVGPEPTRMKSIVVSSNFICFG